MTLHVLRREGSERDVRALVVLRQVLATIRPAPDRCAARGDACVAVGPDLGRGGGCGERRRAGIGTELAASTGLLSLLSSVSSGAMAPFPRRASVSARRLNASAPAPATSGIPCGADGHSAIAGAIGARHTCAGSDGSDERTSATIYHDAEPVPTEVAAMTGVRSFGELLRWRERRAPPSAAWLSTPASASPSMPAPAKLLRGRRRRAPPHR